MGHLTPLHHHQAPNGRVHLSSDVLRLDGHRRVSRRPRRRLSWLAVDILLRFVLPVLMVVIAATSLVGFIWVLLAIGRAVRSLGGF